MDFRSVILEQDVAYSGGDPIGSFESGVSCNDSKGRRISVCNLGMTADGDQARQAADQRAEQRAQQQGPGDQRGGREVPAFAGAAQGQGSGCRCATRSVTYASGGALGLMRMDLAGMPTFT